MARFWVVVITCVPLVAQADEVDPPAIQAPEVDRPTSQAALDHYWKSLERLDVGDRAGSIAELRAGFEVEPWPKFLYLIGKVASEGNEPPLIWCRTARPALNQFRELVPGSAVDVRAKAILDQCDTADADEQKRRDNEARVAAEQLRAREKAREPKRRRVHVPWYRDALGDTLVGSGIVGLAVGGGFYFATRAAIDDAKKANILAENHAAMDRAQTWRTTSLVAGGIGAALVTVGLLRYALRVDHYEILIAPNGVRVGGAF